MRPPALQIRARIACWRSIGRTGLDRERRDIQPARLERLQAAFASMPAPTRDVFAMHRFDDLPYDRIAIRLGIEVDEVEAHSRSDVHHYVRSTIDLYVQLGRSGGRRYVSQVVRSSALNEAG